MYLLYVKYQTEIIKFANNIGTQSLAGLFCHVLNSLPEFCSVNVSFRGANWKCILLGRKHLKFHVSCTYLYNACLQFYGKVEKKSPSNIPDNLGGR